jgi:hypothetical protein
MKVKRYPARNNWRVLIPGRFTETGKQQAKFFETKADGEKEISRILNRGNASKPKISKSDEAAFTLAKDEGLSATEVLDAIRLYKKIVKGVTKKATLEEAAFAFIKRQEHEQKNIRTIYSDRQALRRFSSALTGVKTLMTELSPEAIQTHINSLPPGGTRRTQYARIKKFISWAFREGYTGTDLMAGSKPAKSDRWNSNNEKIDVEVYRRILFVVAGLESIKSGDPPSDRYRRLLPFYVLGGLAGVRRCEIISSYPTDPVIEWTDIYWGKKLITIRDEVAKQTSAVDRKRHIRLEPAAADWLRLVARPSGPMMEISQSTLQRLNSELLDALKLEVPGNGLRNSYASYGQSIWSPGDVAKAMGDNESTVKRWYIETLEPGEGHAWFAIRPGMEKKVVPMVGLG